MPLLFPIHNHATVHMIWYWHQRNRFDVVNRTKTNQEKAISAKADFGAHLSCGFHREIRRRAKRRWPRPETQPPDFPDGDRPTRPAPGGVATARHRARPVHRRTAAAVAAQRTMANPFVRWTCGACRKPTRPRLHLQRRRLHHLRHRRRRVGVPTKPDVPSARPGFSALGWWTTPVNQIATILPSMTKRTPNSVKKYTTGNSGVARGVVSVVKTSLFGRNHSKYMYCIYVSDVFKVLNIKFKISRKKIVTMKDIARWGEAR